MRGRDGPRNLRLYRSFTDRKSTRLNSSHLGTSYAVFCLKQKLSLLGDTAAVRAVCWCGRGGFPASSCARPLSPGVCHFLHRFFLIIRAPPKFTLFPYATLFR